MVRNMKSIVAVVGVIGLLAAGQTASAGARGGSTVHADRVEAYSTDSYRIVFRGGETARIGVVGDGDTTLMLAVYDENGNVIEADRGTTCAVEWTPRWTGRFTVKVRNLGSVYNDYVLLTN
jgi:hypothetical protein